MWSVLFNDNLF